MHYEENPQLDPALQQGVLPYGPAGVGEALAQHEVVLEAPSSGQSPDAEPSLYLTTPPIVRDILALIDDLRRYKHLAKEPSEPNVPGFVRTVHEYREQRSPELMTALGSYAILAAARQQSIVSRKYSNAKVEAARLRYEELRLETKRWALQQKERFELTPRDWAAVSAEEDRADALMAARGILYETARSAERRGFMKDGRTKFYDWWARRGDGGKRHRLVETAEKAAVMGAIGLPIGFAAGVGGVIVAGPVVGAMATAGVARGIARGLVHSHIERNAEVRRVAELQYYYRLGIQQRAIEANYTVQGEEEYYYPPQVTDAYAAATEADVRRNRTRLLGSMVLGAAGGLGGAFLGSLAHHAWWGGHHHPATRPASPPSEQHTSPPSRPPAPPPSAAPQTPPVVPPPSPVAPDVHGPTGQTFYVEHGSGEIREIEEYANAHHYPITPAQASTIYARLYEEHGAKIIDLSGPGPDTYPIHPGDIGLRHPGSARWYPGIEQELRTLLAAA